MDFDTEVKNRKKTVYVPNWFSVDLKTGVSRDFLQRYQQLHWFGERGAYPH